MARIRGRDGWLCLLWLLWGCGIDELGGLTFTLGPRVLPLNTYRVEVYVLPPTVGQTSITCELFVGPEATEDVDNYIASLVVPMVSRRIDPEIENAVAVSNLPEGALIFVVLAKDALGARLARGCGLGQIEPGKKTVIPIYLERV